MLRLVLLLCLPTAYCFFNIQQLLGIQQMPTQNLQKLIAIRQLPRRCRYPAYKGFNPSNPFFSIPTYYYNSESGRCETFNYSGRGGNRNRFSSPLQCLRFCACHAPMDPGTCTNSTKTTRFYFNRMFKMCTTFEFTGCDGNDNNFADFMSCQVSCKGFDMEL